MRPLLTSSKPLQLCVLLVVFYALCVLIDPSEGNYLWRLPPLLKDIPAYLLDSILVLPAKQAARKAGGLFSRILAWFKGG